MPMEHKTSWLGADTDAAAARVQLEALRRLGPAGRAAMVLEMNDTARKLASAGVRRRHPEYRPEQVDRETKRIFLGERIFRRVYGT